MKRKSILGVTLLEIMLVLAIAAMVIVMSIRYYQTATASEQVNTVMEQLQAITAAADNLAQASGSYASANISNGTLLTVLPATALSLPWGSTISVTDIGATSYTISLPNVPGNQCPLLASKIATNTHFSMSACGGGTAATNITVTYSSTT